MLETFRRTRTVASVVLGMYLLTWATAALTLRAYLREAMIEQGVVFFADVNPTLTPTQIRERLTEASRQVDVRIRFIVPVFPGVVIAWHEESGPYGKSSRWGATIRTVFLVYGVGAKALAWRTLDSAP